MVLGGGGDARRPDVPLLPNPVPRNYVPCKTTRRPRLHKFYFPRLTARGKYNGGGGAPPPPPPGDGGGVGGVAALIRTGGRFFMVMRSGNERRPAEGGFECRFTLS